MTDKTPTNVKRHAGRRVGVKLLVELDPDEAERLTELAEEAGAPLDAYVKHLVEEAAAARAR